MNKYQIFSNGFKPIGEHKKKAAFASFTAVEKKYKYNAALFIRRFTKCVLCF